MPEEKKQPQKEFRGLYRYVKVSVSTLNVVIIGGIAAIILILAIGLRNPGYSITFDATGGTPVESQKLMYGDYIVPPTPPTREGYEFAGWYRDINCTYPWNMETDPVSEPVTLYACWIEKSE